MIVEVDGGSGNDIDADPKAPETSPMRRVGEGEVEDDEPIDDNIVVDNLIIMVLMIFTLRNAFIIYGIDVQLYT